MRLSNLEGFDPETCGLTHILSAPAMMDVDPNFTNMIEATEDSKLKICSYLMVIECLFKVSGKLLVDQSISSLICFIFHWIIFCKFGIKGDFWLGNIV